MMKKKNGHGKKINKIKNSIYEGNWKSNKRHGNGKLNVDDKIFFQNFKNGVLLSSVDEASVVGDIDVETDHQINLIEEQKLKLKQNIILFEEEKIKIEQERNNLENEKRIWEEEKEIIDKVSSKLKNIIKLDIGGVRFKTSKSTLTNFDSYFKSMFSGRHAIELDEDGYIFIDRDGTYFHYILNYLRNGNILLPNDEDILFNLSNEVNFYCLNDLKQMIDNKLTKYEEKYKRKEDSDSPSEIQVRKKKLRRPR